MNLWHSIADRLVSPAVRSAARGGLLLAAGLCLARPAAAAPALAVVGSATAAAWLRSAGVDCLQITGDQLAASVPDVPLIVLPLDQIRSEAALHSVTAFAERGGKVVAVYWGTIARPGQQAAYPVYDVAPLLGLRVLGWALLGPAIVRPELPSVNSPFPTAPNAGAGDNGRAPGGELRLGPSMLVQVEPTAAAQVLARLAPVAGGAPDVLALRNGNMYYLAANVFCSDPQPPELRRLFFWILDQAAPGMLFAPVRERAGAAAAAAIRARERLSHAPALAGAAARGLLDQADAAAARARTLAIANRFQEAITAADQARDLTDRAITLMEGH